MTQIITGQGLGLQGSSFGLGGYGPKGTPNFGQGGSGAFVNAVNGNLLLRQEEGFLADIGFGLDLIQFYNSRAEANSNWRFNLQSSLQCKGTVNKLGSEVIRTAEDGHQTRFIFNTNKQAYVPLEGGTELLTYKQTGWMYKNGNSKTTILYDQQGLLQHISDADGHSVHFTYEAGQLTSIVDSSAKQKIIWTFDKGLVRDITTFSDGIIVHNLHFDYDNQERLSKFSRDLGDGTLFWIKYDYLDKTNLISDVTQSDGTQLHIKYDDAGRVQKLLDGEGRFTTYEYQKGFTKITNGLGEVWNYYYDERGRLTGITGPEHYRITYEYKGDYLSCIIQDNQVWKFEYNEAGDCIRVEEPNGLITKRVFNDQHQLIFETKYQVFDGEHHPAKEKTNRYVYDEKGHLRFSIAADGTVTEMRYDAQGLLTSSRCYLQASFLSDEETLELGELETWAQHQNPKKISLVDYIYDWRGQLNEELHYAQVDNNGIGLNDSATIKHFRYDAAGRLVEKSSLGDKGWSTTHYFYDDLGRLTNTIDNQGHQQSFEYDDTHQRIIQTDANGLQTINFYDRSGSLLAQNRMDKDHQYGTIFYKYDAAGRLITETGVDGLSKFYFYDHQGRIQAQVKSNGQVIEYSYSNTGLLLQTHQYQHQVQTANWLATIPEFSDIKPISSAKDHINQNIYNQYNQLAYSINAEGEVIAYTYNAHNQLISATAYAKRLVKFNPQHLLDYDSIQVQSDSNDRSTYYYYDEQGRLQAKINGEGCATAYTYDRQGNLIHTCRLYQAVQKALSGDWTKDKPESVQKDIHTYSLYDGRGLKIADIDAQAYLTEYKYNASGLLKERCTYSQKILISDLESGSLEQIRPQAQSADQTVFYSYNDLDQLSEERSQNGRIITYNYNESGLLTSKTQAARIEFYSYDAFGRLTQSIDAKGGVQKYEYDNAGLLLSKTNALQQTSYYFYDANQQLKYTVNADGAVIETNYTIFGQLEFIKKYSIYLNCDVKDLSTEQVAAHLSLLEDKEHDEIIHYEYNNIDQVIGQYTGTHHLISTKYTAFGEIESNFNGFKSNIYQYDRRGLLLESVEDANFIAKKSAYHYDAFSNLALRTQADLVTEYEYDERGLILRQINRNPLGCDRVVAYEWDHLSRKTATIIDPDGLNYKTSYEYDTDNNLITKTDANQHRTHYIYDANKQCRYQIDARNVLTEYQYDENGTEIAKIKYAHKLPDLDFYDDKRIKEVLIEDCAKDQYQAREFDAQGRLIKSYDASKSLTEYTYDANGNVLSIQTGNRTQHFTYDALNRLRFKCDSSGCITESNYDEHGQVISTRLYATRIKLELYTEENIKNNIIKNSEQDQTIHYAYDALGRLSTEISPQGVVKSYQYDNLDNLIASTQYATRIQFIDFSQLKLIPSKNDRTITYKYDAAGREEYRISSEGQILKRTYDAVGNIIKEQTFTNANNLERLSQYRYDAAGRLIDKTNAKEETISYSYDAENNLETKTEINKAVWIYKYDAANQLIETHSPVSGLITHNSYDSFGNLTCQIRDADGLKQTTIYEYDSNNRKTKTIYPDVAVANVNATSVNQRQEVIQTLTEDIQYNSFGEVIATKDKAGNWQRFAYDDKGQLIYSLNTNRALTQYTYNAFGKVVKKTTYFKSINTDSDCDYSLTQFADLVILSPYDRQEFYQYNSDNQLIESSRDSGGAFNPTTAYQYNAFGDVIKTSVLINENEWAETYTYYNNDGQKIAQIDAEGYLTNYQYTIFGEVESITEYYTSLSNYDIHQFPLPQTNPKDRTISFSYDDMGQLTKKTLMHVRYQKLNANGTSYETLVADLSTSYTYDSLGNITSITDAKGNTAYNYYNQLGQLIAKVAPQTQDGRAATTYSYDGFGNLKETKRWANGASAASEEQFVLNAASVRDICTTQEYTVQGYLLAQTDGLSYRTEYSYDANGNLARTWKQMNASAPLQDKRYFYDSENNLIQTLSYKSNNTFKSEDIKYNSFSEIIAKGINGQFTTSFDYDKLGRVWRTNSQGYYQIFVYDLMDRVCQIVSSTNSFREDYKENGVDLSSEAFEDLERYDLDNLYLDLQRQNNDYNKLGYLQRQTKDDTIQTQTTDRWGNILSHTNARLFTTFYEYNEFNHVIKQELPEVQSVDQYGVKSTIKPELFYAYDALGQLIGLVDANSHGTTKEYDTLGQLTIETDAKGYKRKKHYNLLGELSDFTNELEAKTYYTYDKNNRLVAIQTPNMMQEYEYNQDGQITKQKTGSKDALIFEYDSLGNQINRTDAHGVKTIYEYDDFGHKTKETDALNNTQNWIYNQQGRLQLHTDLGGHTTNYEYNTNGLLLRETSTAGKTILYHYQRDGQLLQYVDNKNNQAEVVDFTYDAEGHVKSKMSSRQGNYKDGWVKESDFYEYDALGRLITIRRPSLKDAGNDLLAIDYEYDAAGNIRHTKYSARGQNTHDDYYTYDENNRMTINQGQLINDSIDISRQQGSALEYDAAGNLVHAKKYEKDQLKNYQYVYDEDNRLELVQKNQHNLQSKKYDNAGRVYEEHLFNTLGVLSQINIMDYQKGVLASQRTKNTQSSEVSLTNFHYDAVGNLSYVQTRVNAVGTNPAYTSSHRYHYALWDSYQQSNDEASLAIDGQKTTKGLSTRIYDDNGLLQDVIDKQVDSGGKSNTSHYWNSSLDGIHSKEGSEGKTTYFTVAGKTIGNVRISAYGEEELTVYSGFTPSSGSLSTGILPEVPEDNLGTYTIQAGDTLESIAQEIYGDSSLWYLLADSNGIRDQELQIGQRINVPAVAKGQHYTNTTQKVLNSADQIGNTSATTPLPQFTATKAHTELFDTVVVAIISTVVTVLTAGILGSLAGAIKLAELTSLRTLFASGLKVLSGGLIAATETSLAAGFASSFIGNLASQSVAKALGMQEGIDLKSALLAGLSTLTSQSLAKGLNLNPNYQKLMNKLEDLSLDEAFNLRSAAEMIEQNAANQALNLALKTKKYFDWQSLGTSTLTAGLLNSDLGKKFNKALNEVDHDTNILTSQLQSISQVLSKEGFNTEIISQNLGDSLSGALVSTIPLLKNKAELQEIDLFDLMLEFNGSNDKPLFKDKAEMAAILNQQFGTSIDFSKVPKFEGEQSLNGYVPMNSNGTVIGKSGITIATGFDIGQHSAQEIKNFHFPKALEKKLLPFVNATKDEAIKLLPLAKQITLTKHEADLLDYSAAKSYIKSTFQTWDSRKFENTPEFNQLSKAQQTVLYLRTFHQGTGMPDTAVSHNFYQAALKNNWNDAARYLKNYHVKDQWYKDRVAKEAKFLQMEH
ncbi:MAG: pesticin C-terminus-like muramidase [Legionella sp.]|jgi:YD repeat-containing protein